MIHTCPHWFQSPSLVWTSQATIGVSFSKCLPLWIPIQWNPQRIRYWIDPLMRHCFNKILLYCSANIIFLVPSLFRCTFTAVQQFAQPHQVATVNHHAPEWVRDEFITCGFQEQHPLKSDHVCMSFCRERCRGCGAEDGWTQGCGFLWTSALHSWAVNGTESNSRIWLRTFSKRFGTLTLTLFSY